ncbi:ComEC/Rec2 family competence protein [Oribacterium sinus]|jgi:competence protein EC|uniref:Putative DNA internalization competence protein ComEC/Rec2-like protein n=1 Tax=Oribacterium sinus F0268 TaxID=585501 RepID=C2L1G3_9FIRM|nr:ComEC/Rec2 family competence protein [Oribacterium sinus]EEJ50149.1 putative DNA internalization competence protein ComEC/Rec2-like protein [Oribacterium sinus F0268]
MFLSRPLFFLALFALLGELILTPEIPFSYRFLFLFSLLFLSLFLFRKKKNRLFFCSLLCLTLFILNFYSVNHRYRAERESIGYILPLQAVLRGKVMYVEEQEKKWKLLLSACIVDTALEKKNSSIKNEEKYQKRNDLHFQKLILYLPKESTGEGSMPLPLPGQICSVKGHFLELSPATNEGEFSLPSYYKGEGISGVFQAKTIELVRGESSPFAKELFTLKQSLGNRIDALFPEETAGFLKSLFLGERSGITLSEKSLYQSAGISHILAISGLHLSLLGGFFYRLLRKTKLSSLLSSLITSFFLFSYFLFTGSSHSAFRALFMLFLRFAAIQLGKGKDLLSQLSFALLFLLWLNPLSLYSIGMQCSFFTLFVFFLLEERPGKAVRKKKEKALSKICKKHALGFSKHPSLLLKLPAYLSKLIPCLLSTLPHRLQGSFLFYLALLPLFSLTQFSFPLYAPLLNLLLLPLLPFFFLLGAVSIFLSYLPEQDFLLLRLLSFSSRFLLNLLFQIFHLFMEKSLALPFSQILLGKMQALSVMLYFLFLYLLFFFPKAKSLSLLLSLGFLLSLPLYLPNPPKELEIAALDVGQGDGFVLRKGALVFTIDNGSTSKNLFPEQIFFPYCKAKRIQHIDYALLTHCDRDHISGIQALLEKHPSISLSHLILPASALQDHRYDLLKRLAYNHGADVSYWQKGDELVFSEQGICLSTKKTAWAENPSTSKKRGPDTKGHQLHIRCFYPNDASYMEEANAHSIGCLLEYGHFRMLFTGDMPKESEEALLENCRETEASPIVDVLKLAHHGSKTSSCPSFLSETRAKFALFSYGKKNRYGHPHKSTVENCKKYRLFPLETAKLGEILIKTNGEQFEITAPQA